MDTGYWSTIRRIIFEIMMFDKIETFELEPDGPVLSDAHQSFLYLPPSLPVSGLGLAGPLSLVELLHYCALIGPELS